MVIDIASAILLILVLVFAVVAIIIWINGNKKVSRIEEVVSQQKSSLDECSKIIIELGVHKKLTDKKLEKALYELDRYAPIIDIEKKAKQIENIARENASQIENHAQTQLDSACLELDASRKQAEKIVEEAKKKALEVAENALEAQSKVREYELAVKAMKNVIEGYGDAYITPSASILDGLADDFGFAEAGIKLKEVRANTRTMIKQAEAARCEYVEENRRQTAIAFVVDAFNGKVDTILSKIKSDNVGKLQQEIEDAFTLVNLNGQAFRNARITQAYKDSRTEELRWGVAVVLLREQERAEQRAIKEKIREEERARKEYERAIRDAAKDEEKLQVALAKVQEEMAKASEDQKAKYEAQLVALTEKLHEAEAKSQRAQSMAQQTRSGHVYVISNIGSFGENVFKIGMTRRLEPQDRVRELSDASVPFSFDVHALMYSEDAPSLETALHKKFNELRLNKVNPRKEFFRVNLEAIRDVTTELNVTTHFTMLAQAQEYRESLAMGQLPKEELDAHLDALLNQETEDDDTIE